MGAFDIPKGESFDVIGPFWRELRRRFPRCKFTIWDIACIFRMLFDVASGDVIDPSIATVAAIGKWHSSCHVKEYDFLSDVNAI
jgi:hypothetical protein